MATHRLQVPLVKTDDESLVFGWASIVADADGGLIVDHQDDVIEPGELEKAAYDFVLSAGATGAMHSGGAVGRLVESMVLTPEKAAAIGLAAPAHSGWWVGFKIDDPEVFAKIKAGELGAFSIEGFAEETVTS